MQLFLASINLLTIFCVKVALGQLPGAQTVKDVYYGTPIGKFNTYMHGVTGDVYAVDENTIYVRNFNYDGQGPSTFFWSGNSIKPDDRGFIIPDEKGSTKTLGSYSNKNLVLRLPEGKTLRDIRWLSVWCREFKVNFGDLQIPRNLAIPSPVEIPQLSRLAHGVKSNPITIVDAQTILVPNFHYDGEGPAGYWWMTRGQRQAPKGLRLKDENGSPSPLRRYSGETVVISLPEDKTIYDFDYFGVWCEEFNVDFGSVRLPQHVRVPPSPKMLGIKPETKLNCEVLYDDLGFELRWVMDGDDIVMQLVGRVEPNDYMAFGLSKDDSKSDMINADAVVAWVNQNGNGKAVDYYLGSKEQCVGNRGSCPDVKHRSASDSITLLHAAVVNGFSMVTFKRPQLGLDEQYDQHIYSDGQQAVMWAIGPLNDRQEVSYHRLHNIGDMFIDFARTPKWNCPLPEDSSPPASASQPQPDPKIEVQPQRRPQEESLPDRKPEDYYDDRQPARQPQEDNVPQRQPVGRPQAEQPSRRQPQDNIAARLPPRTQEERQPIRKPQENRPEVRPNAYERNPIQAQPQPQPKPQPQPESSQNIAWTIPPIACPVDTTFRAQIGPTGGTKGYQGITGRVGWGIAWYINGLLIPEMTLQRGKTYTFIVEGGHDRNNSAQRHPLYLTDSSDGGFDYKSDDERQNEQIFGGVGITPDGTIVPTAEGRLCEWKIDTSRRDKPDNYDHYFDFQRTLNLDCQPGNSGVLRFTPDQTTPDLIYYQCYTHRNLGWKIHIVDNCDQLSGQASIPKVSFAKPEDSKAVVVPEKQDKVNKITHNKSTETQEKPHLQQQNTANNVNSDKNLQNRVLFPEILRNNASVSDITRFGPAKQEVPKSKQKNAHNNNYNNNSNNRHRNPMNGNKPVVGQPIAGSHIHSSQRPVVPQLPPQYGPPLQSLPPYNGPPPYLFSFPQKPLTHSFPGFPSGPVTAIDHIFRPPPKHIKPALQPPQLIPQSSDISANHFGNGFVPMLIKTNNASVIKHFNSHIQSVVATQKPIITSSDDSKRNPFNKNSSVPFQATFKSPHPDYSGFNISRYGELAPKGTLSDPKPLPFSKPFAPFSLNQKPEAVNVPIRYRLKPQNFIIDKELSVVSPPIINLDKVSIPIKNIANNEYVVENIPNDENIMPLINDYSDHILAISGDRGSISSSESQNNVEYTTKESQQFIKQFNDLNSSTNKIYGARIKPMLSSSATTDHNVAEVVDESPLKQESEVSPKTTLVIPLTREQLKNKTDHAILTDVLRLIAQNSPAMAPQSPHYLDKREIHHEHDGHDHSSSSSSGGKISRKDSDSQTRNSVHSMSVCTVFSIVFVVSVNIFV